MIVSGMARSEIEMARDADPGLKGALGFKVRFYPEGKSLHPALGN